MSMVFLLVSGLMVGGFWLWARVETVKRQKRTGKRYPKSAVSTATATPKAMRMAVRKISTYTHNPEVSARLLQSTRKANMSQPLDWCVDKTIHDILRDRR